MERISTWSPSRLANSACPKRCYLQYVSKVPEPPRPELPDGQEYPNDRGTRIHAECESYTRGDGPLPKEAVSFTEELERLRGLYSVGRAIPEEKWGFDRGWRPTDFFAKDVWLRLIMDVQVWLAADHLLIIDYKTGKRFGNEAKHAGQMALYAVGAFKRYTGLSKITSELWYPDAKHLARMQYTPKVLANYFRKFNKHAVDYTAPRPAWPAVPNYQNCFFCPYKTGTIGKKGAEGTGHCNRNPE